MSYEVLTVGKLKAKLTKLGKMLDGDNTPIYSGDFEGNFLHGKHEVMIDNLHRAVVLGYEMHENLEDCMEDIDVYVVTDSNGNVVEHVDRNKLTIGDWVQLGNMGGFIDSMGDNYITINKGGKGIFATFTMQSFEDYLEVINN